MAVTGPIAGAALGLTLVLLGLLLSPSEGQGIVVNASIFHDSFLVGGLGKIHDHFLFVFLGTATTHIVQCACTAVVSTMN